MHRFKQVTLALGDLIALFVGLYLAVAIRYWQWPTQQFTVLIAPMFVLFCAAIIIVFIVGLYDLSQTKNTRAFFNRVAVTAGIWLVLGVAYFYTVTSSLVSPKTILLLTTVIGFGLLTLWRFLYNKFISSHVWRLNIVFAGLTPEARLLITTLRNTPQLGYFVLGAIVESADNANREPGLVIVSNVAEIRQATQKDVDIIILSPNLIARKELLNELYTCLFRQTSVVNLVDFYTEIMKRIPPFTFSENWFIANLHEQRKKIYDRLRILVDYLAAFFLAVFFAITFPFIALAIKLNSPGPIFFKQKRVGRLGLEFSLYKYRTMLALQSDGSAEATGPQFAAQNDSRITRVGNFLRRTRLDEIPQFINIVRSEMGIIGPRPERPEFVKQLTEAMPYYSLRHLIKPGMTGWAQLYARYYGTIDENLVKLEYDLYYIKNRGPFLDLAILLKTINIVLRLMGR